MFSNNIWDLPGADAFILISCDTLIAYRYMAAGCPTTNLGVSQIWGAHIYSVTIFSPVFFCCCCSLFLPHAILQLLYIDITILSWVDSSHIIPIKRHIVQRLVYESSKSLFTLKTSSRAGLSCRTSRFNNCKERGKKNSLMSNCQQSTPDDPRTKNRAPISSICFLFLAPVNLVSGLSRWSHQRSLHCVFQNPVWVHEVHYY